MLDKQVDPPTQGSEHPEITLQLYPKYLLEGQESKFEIYLHNKNFFHEAR